MGLVPAPLVVDPLKLPIYGRELFKRCNRQNGEVVSYKTIAKAIGNPKAVRAVGGANGKNPIPIIVPCHRVIGSDGSLTGFGGGLQTKKRLIDLERSWL